MANDKPLFGKDFDVDRWSTGERDAEGHLVWNHRYPNNDEWEDIRIVTLDFDPGGEGDFRNYEIDPSRPLHPYGLNIDALDYYDIEDLALQAFLKYGFEF